MMQNNGTWARNTITRERAEEITNECVKIKEEFGLDRIAINRITRFYFANSSVNTGEVYSTLGYVIKLLKVFGYEDEEIDLFLSRNGRIYLAQLDDFKMKLGIFAKCGLLKEIIFKHSNYLSYEMKRNGLSIQLLNAVAEKNNYKIKKTDVDNALNLVPDKRKKLLSEHKTTSRTLFMYDYELKRAIKRIQEENETSTLKLK